MKNSVIITLDQGSSSSRALAVDVQGRVVASASRPLQTRRPAPGLAELDGTALLEDQLAVLDEVMHQLDGRPVAALAVASQRSTVVCWDRLTGKPFDPVLSWQDGRAAQQVNQAPITQETLHQLTGLYKTPFYSAGKIAWMLQHVPAVAQAAQDGRLCIGPVATYLIWHLTGGRVFACDPTLAQRTLLFNITTLDWDPALLQAFGITRACLPQIKHSADDYGMWKHQDKWIAIAACVGDQQAALAALRVKEAESCINYGTGAFFMRHTGTQCKLLPGLLTSVAATRACAGKIGTEYLLEGPVNACGTLFDWLGQLGFSFTVRELDTLYPQAKNPVWLLPALGGLGAPYWDFAACPVLAGLSSHTTQADVAAGAVDAISLLLADIVFYAERFGLKSTDIKITGGLSQSHALLTAQANTLQTRLLPCIEKESTAIGAALLAASQMGIETADWQTIKLLPPVLPTQDATQAEERYAKWHAFLDWCTKRNS